MKAQIKRCYRYLDLPFDSTKEDVELRQKVMIKTVRAKAINENKNYDKKIEKINLSALTLLDFIDENGVQKAEVFSFRPSVEDIYAELITMVVVFIVCVTTFLIML